MDKLVLMKLGGSLITEKDKPETPRIDEIKRLAQEIHEARTAGCCRMVVGHGGGSFPHRPAHEYQTQKGVVGNESYRGIALVQDAASRLNRIVVDEFIRAGENAISMQPSACMITKGSRIKKAYLLPLEKALESNMLPVPYGDVAFDLKLGCSIISTETILGFLAKKLGASRIIVAANEEGVWEDFPQRTKLVEEINSGNFKQIKKHLKGSQAVDVTGGMLHKVKRMYEIAKKCNVDVQIINGSIPGRVKDALLGNKVVGTIIKK